MKIKIVNSGAFSYSLAYLEPNSIHKIIEAPKGENSNDGAWIMLKDEAVQLNRLDYDLLVDFIPF